MVPDLDVNFGILCAGGRTLKLHYTRNITNNEAYPYYHLSTNASPWERKTEGTTLQEVLYDKRWDIIILQQGSTKSYNKESHSWVLPIIDWINEYTDYTPAYAWLLTPAYPEGSTRLPGPDASGIVTGLNSSDEMFDSIADCAKWVMSNAQIDFLIPGGTAIQNARHTDLYKLGSFKGSEGYGYLSKDGVHLQEGLPRLIDAITFCQSLSDYLGWGIDMTTCDIAIDNQFRSTNITKGLTSGAITGMTTESRLIGMECIKHAMTSLYSVTSIDLYPRL